MTAIEIKLDGTGAFGKACCVFSFMENPAVGQHGQDPVFLVGDRTANRLAVGSNEARNLNVSCTHLQVPIKFKTTVHYTNCSGVRATCPDCHVSHQWTDKIARKMQFGAMVAAFEPPGGARQACGWLLRRPWRGRAVSRLHPRLEGQRQDLPGRSGEEETPADVIAERIVVERAPDRPQDGQRLHWTGRDDKVHVLLEQRGDGSVEPRIHAPRP